MDRLLQTLVLLLIVVGIGNAFVIWDADRHARDAAQDARDAATTQECLQRAQVTAEISLLTPDSRVDEKGRLKAISTLSSLVDAC